MFPPSLATHRREVAAETRKVGPNMRMHLTKPRVRALKVGRYRTASWQVMRRR
jgi:hypothetical protein